MVRETVPGSSGGYTFVEILGVTTFYSVGLGNGELFHRTDGPAVEESGGTREWYVDGVRHRLDGPAVEANGIPDQRDEWWVLGQSYTAEEFARIREALDGGAPLPWAISYGEGKVS